LKIKNILVSQPQPTDIEKSPYGELIRKYNLHLVFRNFFTIEGIPAREFRKDRVNPMDYSAVIMSSKNAVDHYFRMCKEMRIEVPESMKYFCLAESTAYYLQKYVLFRKRKIFHTKDNTCSLLELIRKHKGEKFLLPCSDAMKQDIIEVLEEQKINYTKAVMYRTIINNIEDLKLGEWDMLVFFSPSGIKSLLKNFPNYEQGETFIGAFGSTTAKAVTEAGLKVHVQAPTQAAPSMTTAIDLFLAKELKKK